MISGEGVHFHQASQGNYHLINLFVVNHLGFPCNSVEHIEKKVWIHLGLKSTDLGIFYKKFLLINILIIGVKLQKHLIKGLGPHLEFLIKAFWRKGAAVSF